MDAYSQVVNIYHLFFPEQTSPEVCQGFILTLYLFCVFYCVYFMINLVQKLLLLLLFLFIPNKVQLRHSSKPASFDNENDYCYQDSD